MSGQGYWYVKGAPWLPSRRWGNTDEPLQFSLVRCQILKGPDANGIVQCRARGTGDLYINLSWLHPTPEAAVEYVRDRLSRRYDAEMDELNTRLKQAKRDDK